MLEVSKLTFNDAPRMLLNQALLNEQSQLAKGTPVPEAFVEEDQMVLSSIAKRIRESIALEPVINAELVVTEVESEPSMTEPIVADTDTDTDTDIGDYIFIDEDIYVDEDIVNGDLA